MKIHDMIIGETATPQLLKFIKSNPEFAAVGKHYVFIWTDQMLPKLLKHITDPGELAGLTTPVKGQIGLGIIDTASGDICVGAIDSDYDALWANSGDDLAAFFKGIKDKKVRRLPSRLQELADLFTDLPSENGEDKEIGQGVQGIVDTINSDDEYDAYLDKLIPTIQNYDSLEDVREYLEDKLSELKRKAKIAKKAEQKIWDEYTDSLDLDLSREQRQAILNKREKIKDRDAEAIADVLEKFLEQEGHLFMDRDSEEEEDLEDDDTRAQIDAWLEDFRTDFPELDVQDPFEFSPQ